MPIICNNVSLFFLDVYWNKITHDRKIINYKCNTLFKCAMVSITSLVNVLPAPDDPINTVGLIDWEGKTKKWRDQKSERGRERQSFHTLIASTSSLTGSWSWAHGCLKCWSDSMRDLTINPYKREKKQIYGWWNVSNKKDIEVREIMDVIRKKNKEERTKVNKMFNSFSIPLSPQAKSSHGTLPMGSPSA